MKRPKESLVFHFPHYQGDAPHSAIRSGDLKLLHFYEDGRDLLFDLTHDLSERRDLAAARPQDAARLRRQLDDYLAAVDAQFPTPNPQFEPSQKSAQPDKRPKNTPKPAKRKGSR